MLRLRPRLRDEQAALAYARTAVVNRCRSVLRRRRTALRYLMRHAAVSVAPPADEQILLAAEHELVLRLFDQLPRRQREAMTLRYFADLGDDEIAETLGISPTTVRSNISRGLTALAKLMKVHSHD
jgi:RNA polymerase sigma factor (sigma-70 family)